MFSLSTEYGNTLDLSDCVLNSLEIESPFISFYNRALEYTVSYYLDDKSLCAEYTGDDVDLENLFSLYWEGLDIAGQRIALALDSQDRIADFHDMPEEYITTAATVILHVMDRFSRDRYDSATYKHILKKNGVKVISATENISDSPEGILLESLLEGLSEYYSAELSVKIQRGQMENAMKGKNNGGTVPLGLRKGPDGVMELDPITAPIVQEIFRRYDKGESMTDIVASLNERGIRTAKDLPFRIGCLGTVLKNRKYIGEYRYGKIVIPDKLPVIIDVELFDRVQRRMEVNRHAPARAKADEEYLLTTKLFCGHCERMLAGESGRSRNGEVHYYYRRVPAFPLRTPGADGCLPHFEEDDGMLHISIVEDDSVSAKLLERYVRRYFEETGGAYKLSMYSDGLAFISEYSGNCNIVLMDIEMPHLDGMTTARKLRASDSSASLIFVTNMAKYALKGYEVDALDFMVKPVEYFNFFLKMDKAVRLQKKYEMSHVLLETSDGVVKLNVQEIRYIESDKHFVIYHTDAGEYRLRGTMNAAEERFAARGFARCGVSYLVNLACVDQVNGAVVTVSGETLNVSRAYKKAFLDALSVYYSKVSV